MRTLRTLPITPLLSLLPAVVLWLFASAKPAAGYVRSYTLQGCHPVYWAQTCVYITADSDGVPEMPLADIEHAIKESITSWKLRTAASSFIQLEYLPASGPREVGPLDGLQVVKFRTKTWCRPADSAMAKPLCYDSGAAAVTTVTYINKPMDATTDGRIVDADIELNAVNDYFYDAEKNPNPQTLGRIPADLWNTLTHELGHLQGLEHSCRRGTFDSMPSCTRDGNGQQVIQCSTVEQGMATNPVLEAVYDTTMYPTAEPRETKKRIPKADDLAGIINTYPSLNDPRQCKIPAAGMVSGGCRAVKAGSATEAAGMTGMLSGLGLLGVLLLRRRRQAAHR